MPFAPSDSHRLAWPIPGETPRAFASAKLSNVMHPAPTRGKRPPSSAILLERGTSCEAIVNFQSCNMQFHAPKSAMRVAVELLRLSIVQCHVSPNARRIQVARCAHYSSYDRVFTSTLTQLHASPVGYFQQQHLPLFVSLSRLEINVLCSRLQ
jgi:hypothetical protein